MAAPSKLTPDRSDRLCKAIADGNYYETACALAGIQYATFRLWMCAGEEAKSGPKRAFFEAVTRAQAEAEERVVALWQARIPEDWQAARDFLARRHPERWGPNEKHRLDQNITLDVGTLSDADLLAVATGTPIAAIAGVGRAGAASEG